MVLPPRKRHGLWWMSMPVPVAVALCVTCFFFGYFTHSVPKLGPSLQTQMLDASIPHKRGQQKHVQPQQQPQPQLQPEVITPQQEQAEVAQLKQQQEQEEAAEHQHSRQQHKDDEHKEQESTHQPQQQIDQQQTPNHEAPQPAQQPQEQQLHIAAPDQQQQHTEQGKQQEIPPAADSVDAEKQVLACMQRAGLLQPLLKPAESGHEKYTVSTYQILSWHPRIIVYPNFIDKQRAQHIVSLVQHRVKRSEVKLRQGETLEQGRQARNSAGLFIRRDDDPEGVLGWLEDKIEAVTLIPASHGEAFYALRYQLNEKYDSHLDVFDPDQYGAQKTLRLATLIVYLSDVEEGGETVFKREGREGDQRVLSNSTVCEESDFKYKPRLGDALLFHSLDPDNSINMRSLHGGCPVIKGTKWVVTKWLHNKPLQKGGFGWN